VHVHAGRRRESYVYDTGKANETGRIDAWASSKAQKSYPVSRFDGKVMEYHTWVAPDGWIEVMAPIGDG